MDLATDTQRAIIGTFNDRSTYEAATSQVRFVDFNGFPAEISFQFNTLGHNGVGFLTTIANPIPVQNQIDLPQQMTTAAAPTDVLVVTADEDDFVIAYATSVPSGLSFRV